LVDFLAYVSRKNTALFLTGTMSWQQFLVEIGVVGVVNISRNTSFNPNRISEALVLKDQTFFGLRNIRAESFEGDWVEFIQLSPEVRRIIYEALEEMSSRHGPTYVRRFDMTIDEYLSKFGREGEHIREGGDSDK
jgi:hypothetical protein